MKKLKPVEPFKYTYRVLDRITMITFGDYENLDKVFDDFSYWKDHFSDGYGQKILHRYILGKLYICRPENPENKGRYAILRVEDGYVLRHSDVINEIKFFIAKRHRSSNEEKYDRAKDLIKNKNNTKKIKENWTSGYVPTRYSRNDYIFDEYYYYCQHMGNSHYGNMINEQRQLEGIVDEYKEEYPNIVRAYRKNLPAGWWSSRAISAYKTVKSWKHHSKRRKQWISK